MAKYIFIFTFILFALLSTDVLVNGDTVVYLQQILNLDLTKRTIHIAFYAFGILFTRLLPVSDIRAINLMTCSFGAATVVVLYLLIYEYCKNKLAAFFGAVCLITQYIFIENSVYAEVSGPQAFFFLLALLFWVKNYSILAGLSYGFSFLITPSAIFALPLFIITKPKLRPLVKAALAAIVVVVPVLIIFYQDYFFGGRGLLMAPYSHITFLTLKNALLKEYYEISQSVPIYLVFSLVGFYWLLRKYILTGLGIISLGILSLIFGEQFCDVPVQLPFYIMLCFTAGLGISLVSHRMIIVTGILIAACGSLSFYGIIELNRRFIDYREQSIRISTYADSTVIANWSDGTLFEYYTQTKGAWLNNEEIYGKRGRDKQREAFDKLNTAIKSRYIIWLVSGYESNLLHYFVNKGCIIVLDEKAFYRPIYYVILPKN